MADAERQTAGITPQELLARSNPGLFTEGVGRDLTNPREMYNILSHKTKSIEDLAVQLKQELAKATKSNGTFPNLSRTLSMNDIDRSDRLGHKHNGEQNVHVILYNRHKTSIGDVRTYAQRHRDHQASLNLPRLSRGAGLHGDRGHRDNARVELPTLREQQTEDTDAVNVGENNDVTNAQVKKSNYSKENDAPSKSKLEKWFSEMPNEEFDRAQRALMEDSIKLRLNEFQRKRKRKIQLPNQSVNVYVGSKMTRVPNTFLELRVDSFGKHLQVDKDRYRLHQKSVHQLKMREMTDVERAREESLPRLALQHRSLTTLALTKSKPRQDAEKTNKVKKHVIDIPTAKCLKTVYMNDTFDRYERDHRLRQRNNGISNYEEYTERLNMMREASEFYHIRPTSPASSHDGEVELCASSGDRDTTKAAIVNIALPKSAPRIRNPPHIQKTLNGIVSHEKVEIPQEEAHIQCVNEEEKAEPVSEEADDDDQQNTKHDPIITKIPTAQSSRTSETKSSSSSIMSNKAALTKFNTLEVFAENGKLPDVGQRLGNQMPHTASRGVPIPASVRLDSKTQQFAHLQKDAFSLPPREVRKPDVIFRFEPGAVHITRTASNNMLRSSERARVIYGKIHNHSRDFGMKTSTRGSGTEEYRDRKSSRTLSTKLDAYRSDLARFETRAIDESEASVSPRVDDGALNKMLVIGNEAGRRYQSISTKMSILTKHDVSTETEVIGSVHTSSARVPEPEPAGPVDPEERVQSVARTATDLSDFIVDNNDGESLDSDDDDDDSFREHSERLKSNHSV